MAHCDIRQKYFVKTTEQKTKPGCWNVLDVDIFVRDGEGDFKIGSYQRNYHQLFNTFCPFTRNGKDYALYSPSYTSTRVMSLPDCKDIGGEEPSREKFCPVDFYVPLFRKGTILVNDKEADYYLVDDECFDPEQLEGKVGDVYSSDFGFVAGCIWQDDITWKIQHLDLSQAGKGIIKRDERFGYIHLPRDMRLKNAIDLEDWTPRGHIKIVHTDFYNPDGKRAEW